MITLVAPSHLSLRTLSNSQAEVPSKSPASVTWKLSFLRFIEVLKLDAMIDLPFPNKQNDELEGRPDACSICESLPNTKIMVEKWVKQYYQYARLQDSCKSAGNAISNS